MDNLAKHGTTFVVFINTIFGMIGLAFLVGGCFVKLGADMLDGLCQAMISKMADDVPGLDLEDFKISEFIGGAANAFIIIGVLLLLLVFWAYFGTCCQSRWMLIVYAIILTLIIIGEVTMVIIFTSNREMIDDAIKEPLKESLAKFYTGDMGQDGVSLAWNAIMGLLKCCGLDGPDDFKTSKSWNYNVTVKVQGVDTRYKLEAPLMCCTDKSEKCSVIETIPITHTYNQGCYSAVWDLVEDKKSIVIGVAAALATFELILWFLVIWIAKELGKSSNKVGPKEKE